MEPVSKLENHVTDTGLEKLTVGVKIEDKHYEALLDSGSNRTLVRQDSLPGGVMFSEGTIDIYCIHGDRVQYPIAEIELLVEGKPFSLRVGVLEKLPYPVVLGSDLPILAELIAKQSQEVLNCEKCLLAVTRSRSKKEQDMSSNAWRELPFADGDASGFETCSKSKERKMRSQRRQDKVRGTKLTNALSGPAENDTFTLPSNVSKMQKEDPSLKHLFAACVPDSTQVLGPRREVFVVKGDLLYRRSRIGDQLVVPQSLRPTILKLSHSIPWAGHLGQMKTFSRMVPHFYWPNQYADTVKMCQSCPECQLTAPVGKGERAPLVPMPIIDVPFSRIAMDIVGPLERSSAGHKYILVVCDYATRYPEAFPLKRIKARQIVNCLIQLFSRVGIPCEIITDQGTNFTSNLLKDVYRLLGIRGVKTSPYHPQTDGLVERFNKTLKSMLRKFVNDTGSDWDQWLPFLMFAYREVPQASTGFSPFQLMYGHPVRGPLDVLKETWEGPAPQRKCG
uniref:Gypsy retrotransposon integrase-like protein 1 n=1 Tax=Oryzias latipes TaxID=8090 RepID=A0A3P9M6S3_ORYLA